MKILKNYLYNAGYQLLVLLLPLITTPYVSRVLGPNGVGDNAYTNSIIQYFVLFANLGISLYGNREIAYVRENSKKLTYTFLEIQIVKILTTVIAYTVFITFIFWYTKYKHYLLLQSLNIVAVLFDISWLYMGLEDFKKTVIRNTLIKIISIILIFIFVRSNNDVGIYIFILAISTLLGNLTLWPFLNDILDKNIDIKELHPLRHLKPTITLFIPQIATQVYLVLNKTMLGVIEGTKYSGFYNYSDSLVKMVLALATALGTVMLPHIANAFANKEYDKVNKLLYKSFDYVTAISIPMAFGLAGIAKTLVPVFYGSGYYPVSKAIMIESIVIVLISWSGTVGTQYLLPTNRVKQYTTSIILGAMVNIILNFPLITKWGLYGAMMSTVFSELIVTLYQLLCIKNIVKLNILFTHSTKYIMSGIIMFIPVYSISLIMNNSIKAIILELVVGVVVYSMLIIMLRKELINEVTKKLKNKRG
ncbi:flippase [Ligilactobacillus salivarius]|uniref:flippase n=1 Tax=Ligilactobacillus salivarius TaxID=1624 RepID=UPI002103BF0B|nr:flippase [Ligilactobacillus salivarius]UTX36518.1 flippase [Ligilactobacillus salivarius]